MQVAFDMTGFNRGVVGLIQTLRVQPRVVVEKEGGELIKTLVRQSPPRHPAKSRAKVRAEVARRFEALGSAASSRFDSKSAAVGSTGVKWYAWDERFLWGTAPDLDGRKFSPELLRAVYYKTRVTEYGGRKGRIVTQFKNRRTTQRVIITRKILTTQQQTARLAASINRNFGRLKAGWLVAVFRGVIRLTGGNVPPQWVKKHLSTQTKGDVQNQLAVQANPSFTIINRAVGIGQRQVQGIVRIAVAIRAKAMATNITQFASGKKFISQYAR